MATVTIKGIISFPTIFTPKIPKGLRDPKYSCGLLIPPTDPQLAGLKAEVEAAKSNKNMFPSGYNGTAECLSLYDEKYAGKSYYDSRFSGWYELYCTAKENEQPLVVDMNRQPIVDQRDVFSGAVVYVVAGVSGYAQGTGGIGGWLNGVLVTDEEPPMGRLDGKPSTVDQIFAGIPVGSSAPVAPTAAPVAPVAPPAPAPAVPQVAPTTLIMTEKANGVTYEQYMATPGWTDQMLLDQGLPIRPSFA